MGFWGALGRPAGLSYIQGVCLGFWEEGTGTGWFCVSGGPAWQFFHLLSMECCSVEPREISFHSPNHAQHLGPSPGVSFSAALNMPEKTLMLQSHLLRRRRDNQGWIFIEHIWHWRIQRHKVT